MLRQCRFIKPLLMREPPDPTSFKPRDIMELLYLGKRFHRLGEARMYDTLRFWTMSCADFLDEYFESEIVKAHSPAAPSSAPRLGRARRGPPTCCCITTWASIDGAVGAWGFARGGMGAVTKALAPRFRPAAARFAVRRR
jgi:phytoene dehydrogenase-like protein